MGAGAGSMGFSREDASPSAAAVLHTRPWDILAELTFEIAFPLHSLAKALWLISLWPLLEPFCKLTRLWIQCIPQ